ncbi:phosphatase PAP2 family protein [Salinibius halmophilus]|uniref:phosphatase PAP2 family protein n=1 Tax=Salinibius halmophilus TaxID=1853216 RepID=UPI000E670CA4|nr:phosphatase PAP2 family protein [Salinibius halmophilus]
MLVWSNIENRVFTIAIAAIVLGQLLRIDWINTWLFYLINTPASLLPSALLDVLTLLGDSATHVLFIAWIGVYKPKILLPALIFAIVSLLLTDLLKSWFDVARPAFALGSNNIFINGPTLLAGAFPSGHSISTAGMAVFLLRYVQASRALLAVAGVVIVSRVMVGAHWPADVVVGAGIGALVALLAIRLGEQIKLTKQVSYWLPLAIHWLFIGCSFLILGVSHAEVDTWLATNLLILMLISWGLRSFGIDWRLTMSAAKRSS